MKHNITTFLWFDSKAEEAARLYCSIFPGGEITQTSPMSTSFELEGQRFTAFNGGPHYQLTPAVSVFVSCDTQAEVDGLWTRFLDAGGRESKCGWLVDAYGLSWQIIPRRLMQLMSDPDRERAGRVVQAMLAMQKIDIAALERAYAG
jgi:predicted 3-demethylubiquinone-9 3-methyltransferase (glyoxalase superfamily)